MLPMQKKTCATHSNNQGFTLLESLFSLLIVIIIASFIPLIFQSYQSILKASDIDKNYEWQVFINQISKELNTSKQLAVSENSITFISSDKVITYEKYQNMLRRSVDNKGHEPLLTNIKQSIWTKLNDQQLLYTVIFEDDQELTARFQINQERS
ncbi:ComGF family competence protein [Listeria booriae]|uniref:ComGF family competence protein n=2 Tax=Listeria booriae TaxID=1552123 RepID=A0A7X0TNF8_9LIST|nr:ComGF family competence protein [Listeria booriae]MBC1233220.1 ComGF family competence protein [Listeria booriae]MBC1245359.1 ComGF family competence protein [Listeria booriae]MBC1272077.1 ComGF family competence protein [Listeria booriae]MBC1331235.1 ComGF family competence protein [Listeria booriae]